MVTLHAYILRELLKTFGLCLTALTILLTMGGGIFNVVSSEGVSGADFIELTPLMIPGAVALAMPVAALFAATMVYGRLAADNEITACRAAGVNVHRLFLSTWLLALFVAASTLLLYNYVLPDCAGRVETFARNNLRNIVVRPLDSRGFFRFQKGKADAYTLTVERVQSIDDEASLRQKGFEVGPGLQYVLFTNPAYLQTEADGALVRYASARYAVCCFDSRQSPAQITLTVGGGREFRTGGGGFSEMQVVGPITVPPLTPTQMQFAGLDKLRRWQAAPWEAPKMRDKMSAFRMRVTCQRLFELGRQRLEAGEALRFHDEDGLEYTVRGAVRPGEARGLLLEHVEVDVCDAQGAPRSRYTAARAKLSPAPQPSGRIILELRLLRTADQDVCEYDAADGRFGAARRKATMSLDRLCVPEDVLTDAAGITPAKILDPAQALALVPELAQERVSLQSLAQQVDRNIRSTVHLRFGFIASPLVTVVMGAILGLMFRGSRALAAFALALVPFFSVGFLLVLGQKLAGDDNLTRYGPLVTWGGLALALVSDGVLLRLGVRR